MQFNSLKCWDIMVWPWSDDPLLSAIPSLRLAGGILLTVGCSSDCDLGSCRVANDEVGMAAASLLLTM
jgi:hypothetical protein